MIDQMRQKHLRQIRMLLGDALLRVSPPAEDMERNTDLMILTAKDKRIACRVRSWRYFERYRDQFTIRSRSRYGMRTEIDKLLDGWGDYMFYGFEDYHEHTIAAAVVIDLAVFRACKPTGMHRKNNDQTEFLSFRIDAFPSSLIVASYPPRYWQTGDIMDWNGIKPYIEQINRLSSELSEVRERYEMIEHYVHYYNLDGDI